MVVYDPVRCSLVAERRCSAASTEVSVDAVAFCGRRRRMLSSKDGVRPSVYRQEKWRTMKGLKGNQKKREDGSFWWQPPWTLLICLSVRAVNRRCE